MATDWPERTYFFDKGLRFECQRCGACCVGAPGTVYVAPGEIESIAGHLALSRDEFLARYAYPFRDSYSLKEEPDGRCCFFRDGCAIYPVRPRQCRVFPFWIENLRSEANWARLAAACPGIGRGRLHSREEILERLAGE